MSRASCCIGLVLAVLLAAPAAGGVDAEGPASLRVRGSILPEGDTDVFRFEAEEGTRVSLTLSSKRRAPIRFAPVLVGPEVDVPLAGARASRLRFSVANLRLPATGAYRLEVAGEGTGNYTLALRARGIRPLRLDARAASLGRPSGGEVLLRRVLGAAGGALVVDDPGSDLDGAILDLPPGAVPDGTPVVLASARAPDSAGLDRTPIGPAAFVGPRDLALSGEAHLTLPVDLELIPADATPVEAETLIVPERGSPVLAAPADLLEEQGLVVVAVSEAGVTAPVVRYGIPRPYARGGDYWFLSYYTQHESSADSRDRVAAVSIGSLTFGSESLTVDTEERTLWWSNVSREEQGVFAGFDAGVGHDTLFSDETLDWSWDNRNRIVIAEADAPQFVASRDGSVLVGRLANDTLPSASLDLAIRKDTGPVVLPGVFHLGGVLIETWEPGNPQAPAPIHGERLFGTLTLRAGGTVLLRATESSVQSNEVLQRQVESVRRFAFHGFVTIEAGGTLLFDFGSGPEKPPPLRAYVGRDGDAMFIVPADPFDGQMLLGFVALRRASRMRHRNLPGSYHGAAFGLGPQSYVVEGSPVPDFGTDCEWLDALIAGTGRYMNVTGDGRYIARDGETGALEVIPHDDEPLGLPIILTRRGKLTLLDKGAVPLVGAISADREMMFFLPTPTRKGGDMFLGVMVREP